LRREEVSKSISENIDSRVELAANRTMNEWSFSNYELNKSEELTIARVKYIVKVQNDGI
jgi:hypothetical protein